MHPASRNSLPVSLAPVFLLLSFPLPAQSPAPPAQSAAASVSATAQSAPAPQIAPQAPTGPLTPAQQLAADTAKLQDLAAEL
ncbi:MAG TPA: hypothetical protein VIM62_01895, partial [Acidobacteriaceae bacterium]